MIEITNLTKKYKKRIIFDNADASFKECGFYALMGESGCGKTTLFSIIMGIEKYEGVIKTNYNSDDMIFISSNNLLFNNLTVDEYLEHLNGDVNNDIIVELDFFNKKNELIKNLSGGEKKKLQIIAALSLNKKVIMLDEPFIGLDDNNIQLVISCLKKYSNNRLIICIIHQKKYEAEFDGVYHIKNKKINYLENEKVKSEITIANNYKKRSINYFFFLKRNYLKMGLVVLSFVLSLVSLCLFYLLLNVNLNSNKKDVYIRGIKGDEVITGEVERKNDEIRAFSGNYLINALNDNIAVTLIKEAAFTYFPMDHKIVLSKEIPCGYYGSMNEISNLSLNYFYINSDNLYLNPNDYFEIIGKRKMKVNTYKHFSNVGQMDVYLTNDPLIDLNLDTKLVNLNNHYLNEEDLLCFGMGLNDSIMVSTNNYERIFLTLYYENIIIKVQKKDINNFYNKYNHLFLDFHSEGLDKANDILAKYDNNKMQIYIFTGAIFIVSVILTLVFYKMINMLFIQGFRILREMGYTKKEVGLVCNIFIFTVNIILYLIIVLNTYLLFWIFNKANIIIGGNLLLYNSKYFYMLSVLYIIIASVYCYFYSNKNYLKGYLQGKK